MIVQSLCCGAFIISQRNGNFDQSRALNQEG